MSDKVGVRINDELFDPTGDFVKNYLFSLQKETPFLDYKRIISTEKNSDFPKFVKDALAFANYGGGFVLLGMAENQHLDPEVKGKFLPTGLPTHFHLEPATLQQKLDSYSNTILEICYDEFYKTVDGERRRFGLIYVKPSRELAIPKKDGFFKYDDNPKQLSAFKKGTVFIRRGTQSIPASQFEIDWINQRVKDENYNISIISGEPDKIDETLYSNLFEIKKFPEKIFLGTSKFFNREDIANELKKHMTYPVDLIILRENKLISLQNLTDSTNPYSRLVDTSTIAIEKTSQWLDDKDKRNIVVSLMNKEIAGCGIKQGMRFNGKTKKLFFSSDNQKRFMSWPSKFRAARRIVANPMHASQIKSDIILHPAIKASFEEINKKFYLKISPTFVITSDGRRVISGLREGTIITKLSYNKYNDAHLNNILFWSNKLSNGNDIHVLEDFVISSEPIQTKSKYGISWDRPTTDLKNMIENYEPEVEANVLEVRHNDEADV